nr:uncharacterized protein LOC118082785 [Zootoca vivipara]
MAPKRKQTEPSAAPARKRAPTTTPSFNAPTFTAISISPEALGNLFSGFQNFFQQVSAPGVSIQGLPADSSQDIVADTPREEDERPGTSASFSTAEARRMGTRSQSASAAPATPSNSSSSGPTTFSGNNPASQLSLGTPTCLRDLSQGTQARSRRPSSVTTLDNENQDCEPASAPTSEPGRSGRAEDEAAKKTSKKKTKKTKHTDSHDDSGTSSSSSEDEDSSLEGYWGEGEDLVGLPVWAHERRANSHRKTFDGTLEWKDGALVPDVKKSTFASSDFILGNHLSNKKRNKILNGDYVDIFTLLPPAKMKGKGEKKPAYGKRKYREPRAERTFENWLDGFQIYMGTIVACYPKRAMHLLAYMAHVRRAYALAGEGPALLYDEDFRRNASLLSSTRWDLRDQNFWGEHVGPYIEKKQPESARSARAEYKRSARRLVCWEYNKGTCGRAYCKYSHECEKCQGSHPATACFKGRQSFRGKRGNFQQGPRSGAAAGQSTSGNRY